MTAQPVNTADGEVCLYGQACEDLSEGFRDGLCIFERDGGGPVVQESMERRPFEL